MYLLMKLFCLLLGLLSAGFVEAQTKDVVADEQLWTQANLRLRVAEKWSINMDGGYRTHKGYVEKKSQSFIRAGAIYHASKKVQLWGGYAYFNTSQWLSGYPEVDRPEHRYWNFITVRESFNRFEIRHRYRLEARWQQKFKSGDLIDGYDFLWRFGYQFQVFMAINNKKITDKTFFLIASDELMVNAGKTIENYFDQNRLAGGIGYQFNDTWRLTGTYQYVYGKQSRGTRATSLQLIWLTLNMNFDLRKKDKE